MTEKIFRNVISKNENLNQREREAISFAQAPLQLLMCYQGAFQTEADN